MEGHTNLGGSDGDVDLTTLGSHQGSEGLADLLDVLETCILGKGGEQVGGGRGQLEVLGHHLGLSSWEKEERNEKKSNGCDNAMMRRSHSLKPLIMVHQGALENVEEVSILLQGTGDLLEILLNLLTRKKRKKKKTKRERKKIEIGEALCSK